MYSSAGEYIIIPKSVLTDARLCKPNIAEFYGVILSLSRQKGYCFASNSYLADFMKCDIRTITNWVTRLKELEYIRVEYSKDDKSNNITLRKIYPVTGVPIDFSIPTDSNFDMVPIDFSGGYGKMDVGGTDSNFHQNKKRLTNKFNKKTQYTSAIDSYTSNPDLISAVNDFIEMRKSIKKPLTGRALELIFKKLDKLANTDDDKIEILNQSVVHNWQGVFELKNSGGLKYDSKNGNDKQTDDYASIGWG